jgi:predicted PurR-regulated permease PerM/methylmalonyl-CoA mutase cobalamin-binding subunit
MLSSTNAPPKLKSSKPSASALIGIWAVLLTSFIIATLYLGRDVLIPVALSALLTFLLAPVVTLLQRWLGRIGAVLLVVLLILAGAGTVGYILTKQMVDLATKLPDYQQNIQAKLRSFRLPTGGRFTKFSEAVDELKKELPGAKEAEAPAHSTNAASDLLVATPEVRPPALLPVPAIEKSENNPFHVVRVVLSPLLGPLGTAALVLLLVIFMLLKREDLRSRIIRLIGQGHISATTRAMDDAGARVARYLLMQLIVNLSYGILVAVGLHFIGVPNAPLWGAFATVLRFIPYVGPWIGATLPIGLSLAVSPGWTMPLLTIGLFVLLELLSNNVLEPWLYGSSTGVTPVALIFAALFWTWMWGPVGLVLATPLTVCLVVMGRHIPRLSFLGILLSDEEALTPAEDCYYRLLTAGEQDESELVEAYLRANPLTALYDSVFVPVITRMETDYRLNLLDEDQKGLVEQSLTDLIDDAGARAPSRRNAPEADPVVTVVRPLKIFCLPARASHDEIAGTMLAQLLHHAGIEVESAPPKLEIDEIVQRIANAEADVVFISVVAPSTVLHARYLCLKLRARLHSERIVVGLWGYADHDSDAVRRVQDSGADEVATTFKQAVAQMQLLRNPTGELSSA